MTDLSDARIVKMRLFQAKVEECPYAFQSLAKALKAGGPHIKDYKLVHTAEYQFAPNADPLNILDRLYSKYNADDRPGAQEFRSMSVSDIIELTRSNTVTVWYCDPVDFKQILIDMDQTAKVQNTENPEASDGTKQVKVRLFQPRIAACEYQSKSLTEAFKHGGPNPADYELTLEKTCEFPARHSNSITLEELLSTCSKENNPNNKRLRDMSVSDIIELTQDNNTIAYYCGAYAFELVDIIMPESQPVSHKYDAGSVMPDAVRVFNPNSVEHKKLQFAARWITRETGAGIQVSDTFYDVGQNWMWTTLIAETSFGSCQILTPRLQAQILFGDSDGLFKSVCGAARTVRNIIDREKAAQATAQVASGAPTQPVMLDDIVITCRTHPDAQRFVIQYGMLDNSGGFLPGPTPPDVPGKPVICVKNSKSGETEYHSIRSADISDIFRQIAAWLEAMAQKEGSDQ